MIIGNIKQNKYVLSTDNQDSFLAYEGSGNLELEVTFNDSTFQGYTKNFFYCKKTLNSKTYDLQFNASKNTVTLPPSLFSDEGKIFIGLVGSKIENDAVVQINTSPVCFYNGKAVNPLNIKEGSTEGGSSIGLGVTPAQAKALDNLLRNCVFTQNVTKEYKLFKRVFDTGIDIELSEYTITTHFTNVMSNNGATSVKENSIYDAQLTPTIEDYSINSVIIMMGNENVTDRCYKDGSIHIESVTGNIVITAIATEFATKMYSITNVLTNVANNNPATMIEENSSYVAKLTPMSEYEFETVTIMMGESNITDTAYLNGNISIERVTGNVTVTAKASKPTQEVTILKSLTGDGQSYIDTGVFASNKHRYEISFTSPDISLVADTNMGESFFGVDQHAVGSPYSAVYIGTGSASNIRGELNGGSFANVGTWNQTEQNILTNKQVYAVVKNGSQDVFLDKEYSKKQTNYTGGTAKWGTNKEMPIKAMYLFYTNSENHYSTSKKPTHTKIYWFRIYDDETSKLLYEFLPAKKGIKIGMYDSVNKKFYENIGTGTFSYEEAEA